MTTSSSEVLPARSTYTAQRHFHLTRSRLDGGQAVGHAEAEVVMTVNAEYGLVRIRGMLDDIADQPGIFAGNGITDGIGKVDGGRAGLDHFRYDAHEEIRIGAEASSAENSTFVV